MQNFLNSLTEKTLELLSIFPPWLIVIIISMVPFIELRGSIPVAIGVYHMNIGEAFILSIIGNMIPVPFILFFLGDVERFLRRYKRWNRFFDWLFERTRKKASKNIEKYEVVGLMIFVGIPLPMTGAWTGALIAYLFGLDYKKSFLTIFAGVLMAGVIMTLAVVGLGFFI
jgi:uncharacterized membrane protein